MITIDFEVALYNAAYDQFGSRGTIMNGCLFHWKQAIRRHLSKLKLNNQILKAVMHKGRGIDLLTLIPHEDILSKGVPCVKFQMDAVANEEEKKVIVEFFSNYFTKFWMSSEEKIKS